MKRIKRLLLYFRLFFMDGLDRAKYLKKTNYFASQGENCYFAVFNFGTEPELVSFGDNVVLATGVRIITHDMSAWMISVKETGNPTSFKINRPVKFGNNVFVGADCCILPGVVIGDNVIIGAGSVVTKAIESDSVYAGVPAKKISTYSEYSTKLRNASNE